MYRRDYNMQKVSLNRTLILLLIFYRIKIKTEEKRRNNLVLLRFKPNVLLTSAFAS